jgi:hypothetical protein
MKAITLTQPWATLVAIGAKTIETRSWRTNYRGPLAIHAAMGWKKENVKLTVLCEPFRTILRDADYPLFSLLPRGCVVAVADLVDCFTTDEGMQWGNRNIFLETAFGDFSPGRYAWALENIRALPKPIPAKGALGLWDWPAEPCPRCDGQRFDRGTCAVCDNIGLILP